ncbi:receptor-type tyrosine-protein phosphatase S-like isoform X1 [Haliotis rufescens]|uniref:receptor-type tyrosine-protein phosphatase S-like isoform X1 n=1 Tax=Haliotis rufescens TaxID=6454 RepID=UPI00201EC2A8|nr:receptor-type tyrosine-protein phosphatase S-like isoform X1 [Haliotis rufescens]
MATAVKNGLVLVEVLVLTVLRSPSSTTTEVTPATVTATAIPGLGEGCTTECSPPDMVECVNHVCQCIPPLQSTGKYCVTEPGPVGDFSFANVTDSTVSLTWEQPTTPGVIQYYDIVFNVNGMCFDEIVYQCTQNSRSTGTCGFMTFTAVTSCNGTISYDVSSLLPYKNYSMSISARNDIYDGPNSTLSIQTDISAPLRPRDVEATVLNASVIRVSWSRPFRDNGPTWYNVTVWEATGRRSSNFTLKTTVRVDGFNTTSCVVQGLLSSWKYYFKVTAYTPAGSAHAPNASGVVMTLPAEPGPVENLTASALPEPYFGMLLTWNCPEEKQRNGRIMNYTLHYKGDVSQVEHYGRYTPEDPCTDTKSVLVPMAPAINYTFTVFANAEFTGKRTSIISRMGPKGMVFVLPARASEENQYSKSVIVVSAVCGTVIVVLLAVVVLLVIYTRILPSKKDKYESTGIENSSYRSLNNDQLPYKR